VQGDPTAGCVIIGKKRPCALPERAATIPDAIFCPFFPQPLDRRLNVWMAEHVQFTKCPEHEQNICVVKQREIQLEPYRIDFFYVGIVGGQQIFSSTRYAVPR